MYLYQKATDNQDLTLNKRIMHSHYSAKTEFSINGNQLSPVMTTVHGAHWTVEEAMNSATTDTQLTSKTLDVRY